MNTYQGFPAGESEAGRAIAKIDWSTTTLGPISQWPAVLKIHLNLILNSPDSMYLLWGPELLFFHNDAYAPLLGPRLANAQGAAISELWADVWDQVLPFAEQAMRGVPYQCHDMPLTMARFGEMERTWWSFSFSPMIDENNAVVGLFCTTNETTRRVLDQRALRSSESRRMDLIADLERKVIERSHQRGLTWQVSPDLLAVLADDLRFETTNPAWRRVLGWSDEELSGFTYWHLVHPDDLARSQVAFGALAHNHPVLNFENRYRRKDGSYRWLSWVAVPEGGKMYCSARDVTTTKQQAAELSERTEELDRLWEISPDLLAMVDFDGHFLRVNPAWTHVLGRDVEELIGTHMLTLVHPDDLEKSRAALGLATGQALPLFENRYRHNDGTYRWIGWTAAPGSEVIFALGKHMTAEKERSQALRIAEEALRQSQKMEAVGQLTGGLAHDFNNLLMGVSGNIELLKHRVAKGRTDDLDRYIHAALEALRRAAALTHRLLAFSRRQTLDPKPTDIDHLVEGMAELIRRTVGPSITMDIIATHALWSTLVDAHQLENSLLNLCLNARDAMPDGGQLLIETSNKQLGPITARELELPAGDYVALCVSDTGTGMTPEVVKRAFDPFFTTKPIGMGTGLGLSMIYGFARQSGGGVQIFSTPGRGSIVCIYLPARIGSTIVEEIEPRTLQGQPQITGSETVLVVDDEPAVRPPVCEVLEELGYRVLEAEVGPSALNVLQSKQAIDLLITDVGLPGGMNGRQLADAARSLHPALKVLFVTGYAENAVLGESTLAPGMHVLTKPFSMPVLSIRVKELLEE
ncbi:MAG TPA: PAS domain S-box protein [Pseudomonas sp.]|uniref:hybrid sensor histidine kinase/response regulator n=1 Tax=Pseudomonas sp. TaxID=306 RepID=UPI002ED7C745